LTHFATLAEEAKRAEQNAKASETNASASAVSAANDATAAQQSATKAAESEAAAKLAADQCEASVSGVASFNGRGGHVKPQSGDYTAAMVGALALNGSNAMTGNLTVEREYPCAFVKEKTAGRGLRVAAYPNSFSGIENYKDGSNYRGIRINTESDAVSKAVILCQMKAGQWSEYNILHTGNKPSGSYTGNGSATSRTIDTKGIGHVMIAYTSVSIALVTYSGAICCNLNTGEVVATKNANFRNGVLTLTTAGDFVNYNSNTYNYQVL
jgi:hypothetical protein